MEITEARERGVAIVAPAGRIDSTTSDRLEQHLVALVKSGARRVVVDMSGVEYISSAGLRVMLALAKRIKDVRGALAICALSDPVKTVFSLAGFLPLFVVDATRDAAVTRVAAP